MKIYIVTSGCYSDYGIDAVFLDEKEAEKYIATKNKEDPWHDNYGIEEYETQDGKINIGNNVIGYEYEGYISKSWYLGHEEFVVNETADIIFQSEASKDWDKVWLKDKNYELAKKILCDRFAEHQAKKEGIV